MQNFDQNELNKFEKMAITWWDPNGDFKPIHQLNPLRLQYILDQSNGLFAKNVLDVGCGGGILSESMAKQGAKVTGIDMSIAPLEVAKMHAKESSLAIDYQQSTIEDFLQKHTALVEAKKAEKFDVITCMEMLEHVPDPVSIITSCQALLKTDGVLFFSTINRTFKAWALVVLGAEYILKLLPKGTHDYDKFIRPSELLRWSDEAGLHCQDMCGYHYNPFLGRFWFNDDVSANYIATFKKS
ncbi:bifunctional 2-polyprenyl-6-hydroxyphenol methylase/3-demethylubiquinol 3-O-methyltransferase UbiG [Seminibacterium arietis]|uniref:Ubiquinone biosynthesis O-methyltransferase n=1 Tax=Seminibacterium arietis TaxID=1173502 RepID=A0ABW3I613_9PAST